MQTLSTITDKFFTGFITVCLLFCCYGNARAQAGFYVPKKGKVFFAGDTSTIFSSVVNQGKLGVGKKAVVNFKGKKWENDPASLITDETRGGEETSGQGGTVRFMADSGRQQLTGGYNAVLKQGPAFSQLHIQNKAGVELQDGSSKILSHLLLSDGLFYLHNNVLIIGNNDPGIISGYDADHFMVTGNAPGSGLLLRENIRATDGLVVFPVGSRSLAYTPAAIQSKTNRGDDYYVTVFDGVKQQVFTGSAITSESVNKTWEVGKRYRPGRDVTEVHLQHLVNDEGTAFAAARQWAYVSAYNSAAWDLGAPQSTPAAGNLTSGPALVGSGVNSRTFTGAIGSVSYFTKFTGKGDTTRVWLSAYRTDWKNVRVYWSTRPEVSNRYFVVQRKLNNEDEYTNIDTVLSAAANGYSASYLHYAIMDKNDHRSLSYYRLMLVNYNGRTTYSNIVAVGPQPGGNQLLLWPNPSSGRFFAGLSRVAAIKTIVIWNAIGQKIREVAVNERSIIDLYLNIPGTYMVGFITYGGQVLETQKLVITGH